MTDTPNHFEAMAERQIPNPVKSRMRAVETRRQRALEKEKFEKDYLQKEYEKWHLERKNELLTGRYSEHTQMLAAFLERMSLYDAPKLIELVETGPLPTADRDTKFLALSMISNSIVYLRERAGLVPFEDSIPFSDEEPTAFEIIRSLLS